MKPEDFIGVPCWCPDCTQAGIAGEPKRRDPQTGHWMHGYQLKRWLEARAAFRIAARAAVTKLVMK